MINVTLKDKNYCQDKIIMKMALQAENFILTFAYNPIIINDIKSSFTIRGYLPLIKAWIVPADWIGITELFKFSKKYDIKTDKKSEILINKTLSKIRFNYAMSNAISIQNGNIKIKNGELREFQKVVPMYLERNNSVLIADDMGLGKSLEALVSIENRNAYPCLIICPANLKFNWENEVHKWLDRHVGLIHKKEASFNEEIIIINYDILKKYQDKLMSIPFQSIILDEIHYCKSSKTNRTKLVRKIANKILIKIGLTGTPILNRPNELISQLQILDRLDPLGGYTYFSKRYCQASYNRFGYTNKGADNLDELHTRLRSTCLIRRTKQEVLSELPEKERTIIPVEIDNRNEYQKAEKDFITWLKEVKGKIGSLSAEAIVKIEYLKQIVADGKLNQAIDWIKSFLKTEQKLVVFSNHIKIQQNLLKNFPFSATIFGKDCLEKRQESVNKFQTDDNYKLILCSLKAGGVGITLTASSTVLFLELGWTPADHEQAEDRIHRIGQTNQVNIYYMIGYNTIEDWIVELINKKRTIIKAITDGQLNQIQNIYNELIQKFIKK